MNFIKYVYITILLLLKDTTCFSHADTLKKPFFEEIVPGICIIKDITKEEYDEKMASIYDIEVETTLDWDPKFSNDFVCSYADSCFTITFKGELIDTLRRSERHGYYNRVNQIGYRASIHCLIFYCENYNEYFEYSAGEILYDIKTGNKYEFNNSPYFSPHSKYYIDPSCDLNQVNSYNGFELGKVVEKGIESIIRFETNEDDLWCPDQVHWISDTELIFIRRKALDHGEEETFYSYLQVIEE